MTAVCGHHDAKALQHGSARHPCQLFGADPIEPSRVRCASTAHGVARGGPEIRRVRRRRTGRSRFYERRSKRGRDLASKWGAGNSYGVRNREGISRQRNEGYHCWQYDCFPTRSDLPAYLPAPRIILVVSPRTYRPRPHFAFTLGDESRPCKEHEMRGCY